jgi:hypothetical protein
MPARMANNDFPVLDGISPSWADIIMKMAAPGAPVFECKDIKAVNTGVSIEVGEHRRGGRLYKRTTGSSKSDGSITVYRDAWDQWLENIGSLMPTRGNQRIYGLVHFGLQIQHTPPGSVKIFERRLKGCRIMGSTFNGSEGIDADVIEIPLSIVEIADVIGGVEYVIL